MDRKLIHVITFSLAMLGALNWGLVGLFGLNLVDAVFGPALARLVYIVIGVAAGYVFVGHKDDCKICSEMMKKK